MSIIADGGKYDSKRLGSLEEFGVVDGSAAVLVHLLELLVQLLDVHGLQLLAGRERLHHRVHALVARHSGWVDVACDLCSF